MGVGPRQADREGFTMSSPPVMEPGGVRSQVGQAETCGAGAGKTSEAESKIQGENKDLER